MTPFLQKSRLLPAIVVALGLVASFLIVTGKPDPESKPVVQPPPPQVQVMPATPETVTLTAVSQGTVQPRREINVVAQVGGIVVSAAPEFADGGFLGVVVWATGGVSDRSFGQDFAESYASSSIALGPINNLDKRLVAVGFGSAITRTYGGYSALDYLLRGPAPHLGTHAGTFRLVVGTTTTNAVLITASYESGNAAGAFFRTLINRAARIFY